MKKLVFMVFAAIFGFSFAFGAEFCEICGMNLEHHKKSSHELIDGEANHGDESHTCSLHCAFEKSGKSMDISKYKGFDNVSGEFRSITDLFYVIGSSKKSAMTSESEFAFSTRAEAEKFAKENGGRIIEGKEILEYESKKFDADSKMIKQNRAKMALTGKKIAEEYCEVEALEKLAKDSSNVAIFKTKAKGHCKNIDGKGLHAVSIYFWDKR
ncbi:hypothetical protein CCY99_00425 [Helicobacter sp. 16-1353]|uniref:nitrous oxide reductase accessory protein NosL n=1 Tax=Helicobacter sp. 16-1353 TaxID=2004996 RepID=UPI000DCD5A13|nr:nitrous oxide reductase accessory protein NosL [Helicobacter sp. 16-1353]RAX55197.1 hypothetical protein CCY99_00425 [Helicobacter sp. 16-1353]